MIESKENTCAKFQIKFQVRVFFSIVWKVFKSVRKKVDGRVKLLSNAANDESCS